MLSAFLLISAVPSAEANTSVFCTLLSEYNSVENVAYKKGVDVRGNSVALADLNSAPAFDADIIRIPVSFDILRHLDENKKALSRADGTTLTMVSIHRDGRVSFSSEDITEKALSFCNRTPVEEKLVIIC